MGSEYTQLYESPIGLMEIKATVEGIVSVLYINEKYDADFVTNDIISSCIAQFDDYFAGKLQEFSINVIPSGTPFQLSVWKELVNIPFGETISYIELAERLNNPKSVRAVGGANGKNPINIIVPCHRVIGKNGTLTGYGGGLWRKEWLLEHELKYSKGEKQLGIF